MGIRVAVAGPQAGAFRQWLSGRMPAGVELTDAATARRADWVLVSTEPERVEYAARFGLPPARVVRSEILGGARDPQDHDAQARVVALLEKMRTFGPPRAAVRAARTGAVRSLLARLARRMRPPLTAKEEAAAQRAALLAEKAARVRARLAAREAARLTRERKAARASGKSTRGGTTAASQ